MYCHCIHKVELQSYAIFPIRATFICNLFFAAVQTVRSASFYVGISLPKESAKTLLKGFECSSILADNELDMMISLKRINFLARK